MDASTGIHRLWDIINDNLFSDGSKYPRARDNTKMCGPRRVCCMDRSVGEGNDTVCTDEGDCTQPILPQPSCT